MSEYDEENPVEADGTYCNGKFVCTQCYVMLVDVGLDVGTPEEIQAHAIRIVKPLNS